MEFGDLAKFVTARLRYLALPPDEQGSDSCQFAFSTFSEYDTVGGILSFPSPSLMFALHSQVYGIASGLQYLHSRGIIHGDIKGQNVLLDGVLRPLLCDFGMTKTVGSEHDATSTAMKGAGSMRWMAPEVLNGASKTLKSDAYAFGMTIVEVCLNRVYADFTESVLITFMNKIVTGLVPFPRLTPYQLVLALHNGDRPAFDPLERLDQNFVVLWRLAEMCWDSNPTKRPSAVQILNGTSIAEHPETQSNQDTGLDSRMDQQRRQVLATLSISVLLIWSLIGWHKHARFDHR